MRMSVGVSRNVAGWEPDDAAVGSLPDTGALPPVVAPQSRPATVTGRAP